MTDDSPRRYGLISGETAATVRRRLRAKELEGQQDEVGRWHVAKAEFARIEKMQTAALRGRERPRKERLGMAAIRGMYTFGFTAFGFVVTYVADNFMSLGIASVPLSLAIGAGAYSLKRLLKPDGTW